MLRPSTRSFFRSSSVSCGVRITLTLLVLSQFIADSDQGPHEKHLLEHLFLDSGYNKLERPVANESDALVVSFGLVLQQIIDVDEKNQIIHTNLWLNMIWNDYSLVWNQSEFGNIKSIRVPPSQIWKPDIIMYNSADEDIDSTFPTNVVVTSDGNCLWVPPGMFLSTCKIDISWFPFDDQQCKMKFGSWTYDSDGIDLQLKEDSGDISTFISNGEWELIGLPANRNVVSYECCPERYIDVTFTIHIRRRYLYYGFNLIIPCVLISSMALLTFTLPPDAGEKISLGVTILLSLTVFLLLVAETMPPTSDAVPLIGSYFAGIMLMCSLSVVCTVLVLNYHHRSPDTHDMPPWVKKGICEWLAWIVRIKRPVRAQPKPFSDTKTISIELNERSSHSLLANVLDLDDDFQTIHSPNCANHQHIHTQRFPFSNHNLQSTRDGNGLPAHNQPSTDPPTFRERCSAAGSTCCAVTSSSVTLLQSILRELQYMTDKVKADDARSDLCSDWKFAAMVIDRLCLWLFTVFTFVSTVGIMLSAPNVIRWDD